jgi:hypothetical protein
MRDSLGLASAAASERGEVEILENKLRRGESVVHAGICANPKTHTVIVFIFQERERERAATAVGCGSSHNSVVVWPATLSLRAPIRCVDVATAKRDYVTTPRELRRKCRNIASSHRCWPDCGK